MILSDDQTAFVNGLRDEDGVIDVDELIALARDPNCCLHELFTWDLSAAAKERWAEQAREVVRSVKVEYHIETRIISSVGYAALPSKPGKYVGLDAARHSRGQSQQIMQAYLQRVINMMRSARSVAKVLGLTHMVDNVIADLDRLSEVFSRPAPSGSGPKKPRGGGPKRPRGSRGGGEARV